jgi:copper chaperone CopZ
MAHSHWMLPGVANTIAAFALLAVLGYAFFRPAKVGSVAEAPAGRTVRVSIEGMTCGHCADAVRRALLESAGAVSAEVDLKRGEALVAGSGLDETLIAKAVESLGYRVTGIVDAKRSGTAD